MMVSILSAALASNRWAILLTLLLIALLIEPLFGHSDLADLSRMTLFVLVVVGAVFATHRRPVFRIIAGAVVSLWLATSVAVVLGSPYSGTSAALTTMMVAISLLATFSTLSHRHETTFDVLLGSVFGFFLLAMVLAALFLRIEQWQPGSFDIPQQEDLWTSMLYFSLVTITTLGYGDILPVTSLARVCTAFEAAIGVLYVAAMVGSIVGSYKRPD